MEAPSSSTQVDASPPAVHMTVETQEWSDGSMMVTVRGIISTVNGSTICHAPRGCVVPPQENMDIAVAAAKARVLQTIKDKLGIEVVS